MLAHARPAIVLTLAFTLLTGLAYPLAMTGLAALAWPEAAKGSLIVKDGKPVGSDLIAQKFEGPAYAHPRPSASDWNAAATGASNLGPTSAKLLADITARRDAFRALNGTEAPPDAVTTSASGLDPHISPENARAQAPRIAAARGVATEAVLTLVAEETEPPFLGLFGLPRVNVLRLNLALDAAFPKPPS